MILGFVVLVTLLKYPFFEYGSRYANSTQTSIIDGYKKLGKPALWLYFLLTIASMFFVTGAVGFVTAGFFENLFGNVDFFGEWTIIILVCNMCYQFWQLEDTMFLIALIKIVAITLLVSTVSAFLFALYNGPIEHVEWSLNQNNFGTATGIFFLLSVNGLDANCS